MPQNPYNEPPTTLGKILNLVYGIVNRPYDSVEMLWTKVARSLGASVSEADDLETILSRVVDAGGTPPPTPEQGLISATPDTDDFLSMLGFSAAFNNPNLPGVTSLSIGLSSSTGFFDLQICEQLESLSFPNLVSLGDGDSFSFIAVRDALVLTSLSAPLLQTAMSTGGDVVIDISFNIALPSLSFPSLVTTDGPITIRANDVLTSLSFPLWVPNPGDDLRFDGNALDVTSVNHILARCVANPAWGPGDFLRLDGGTNAAPSGQGAADVITLTGRGATVMTN